MSVRTTATAVKKIVETDTTIIVTDADLDPYIEAASAIVDDVCATITDADGVAVYSATRLELIERWLSAHFYAIRDPRLKSESVEGISASPEGATAMHLNHTRYGQQAMVLDTKGGLAGLQHAMANTKKAKIGIHFLGKKDIDGDGVDEYQT